MFLAFAWLARAAESVSERAAKVRERAANIRFWDDSGFLVGLVRQQSSIGAF